jgi:hypothetical protein
MHVVHDTSYDTPIVSSLRGSHAKRPPARQHDACPAGDSGEGAHRALSLLLHPFFPFHCILSLATSSVSPWPPCPRILRHARRLPASSATPRFPAQMCTHGYRRCVLPPPSSALGSCATHMEEGVVPPSGAGSRGAGARSRSTLPCRSRSHALTTAAAFCNKC